MAYWTSLSKTDCLKHQDESKLIFVNGLVEPAGTNRKFTGSISSMETQAEEASTLMEKDRYCRSREIEAHSEASLSVGVWHTAKKLLMAKS